MFIRNRIGLVIIDSVAAIYRLHKNAVQRASDLRKLVLNLQRLGAEHECAIVCVNQVRKISKS